MRAMTLAMVLGALFLASPAFATEVKILWLERRLPPPPVLSNLDPVPEDLGLQGAALGVADSNTTGRFLNQSYKVVERYLEQDEPLATGILGDADLVVAKLPGEDLLALADLAEAEGALIFNAGVADTALRREACRAGVENQGALGLGQVRQGKQVFAR